jgi:hypothetical protein
MKMPALRTTTTACLWEVTASIWLDFYERTPLAHKHERASFVMKIDAPSLNKHENVPEGIKGTAFVRGASIAVANGMGSETGVDSATVLLEEDKKNKQDVR